MVKSAFQFKLKYVLEILFVVFGFMLVVSLSGDFPVKKNAESEISAPLPTEPRAASASRSASSSDKIVIDEAVVCLDIHEGEPLLAKQTFSYLVDRLYCYVALSSPYDRVTIVHRWFHDARLMNEKTFTVEYGSEQLISSLPMQSEWIGPWEVVISDGNGRLLQKIRFELR